MTHLAFGQRCNVTAHAFHSCDHFSSLTVGEVSEEEDEEIGFCFGRSKQLFCAEQSESSEQ